jgi:hypothetical protein
MTKALAVGRAKDPRSSILSIPHPQSHAEGNLKPGFGLYSAIARFHPFH